MPKKILVLTSSGRENSNSTAMAQALAQGAMQAGNAVATVNLFDLSIEPCKGCGGCRAAGNPCVFQDDFAGLAKQILESEVIVFAAPLYWYTFPAKAKLAIDKFVSFLWGSHPIQGKQAVLLSCATEEPIEVFRGIETAYECTLEHLGWTSAGKVLQPGVPEAGDVAKTDALERCRQLGAEL